ncbi:MAG: SCO6880 family protein, partial [Propionicimonas sp.]
MSLDTQAATGELGASARYGGWHPVTSPGIGRLGLASSLLGVAGLVCAFVVGTLLTPTAGLIVAVLVVVAVVPLVLRGRDGRSGYAAAGARLAHRWARRRGRTRYTPALLGGRKGMGWSGPCPAPGLLARAQLRGVVVPLWGEVGVLRTRADRWSVLLAVPVEPAALVDPNTLAAWSEGWGQWLAQLPHETQVVAATVTVESGPDTGHTLASESARLTHPEAPNLARAFLDEVASTWPGGSLTPRVWVTLTFTTHRPGRRPATAAQMTDLLVERVPGLCASLARTGAGRALPMTPDQVVAIVRGAWDPSAIALFEAAAAAGEPHGISFADAGPVAARDEWDHLAHDDAVSCTWRMTAAPPGGVHSRVLAPLLDPHPGLLRKRVTLIYRHHQAAEAARIADADLRTAAVRAGERRGQVRA